MARIFDGQPSPRKWAFVEHRGKYWVRDQRWKLYGNGKLFDVSRDPAEKNSLQQVDGNGKANAARTRLSSVLESLNVN